MHYVTHNNKPRQERPNVPAPETRLSYLLIGLIPVLAMAVSVYLKAGSALREQSLDALEAVATIKQRQLLADLKQRQQQVESLASSLATNYEGLDVVALTSAANYDRPIYQHFVDSFGYHDLQLLLPDGKPLFRQSKDSAPLDVATQQLFRSALDKNEVLISDLRPAGGKNQPASLLLARAIREEDGAPAQSVLLVELPLAGLNTLMQSRQGLGEAGETYLVGADGRLRSDSARFTELTALGHSIDSSDALRQALSGSAGRLEEPGLKGEPALKAFLPVQFGPLNWALIAEMDEAQAFAPVRELMVQMLLLGVLTVLGVVAVTAWVSRSLMRLLGGEPQQMVELARRLAAGELTISARQQGERVGLMRALSEMATAWRQIVEHLSESNRAINHTGGAILDATGTTRDNLDRQQQSIEQVVAAIEQMVSTVRAIADSAASSAEGSEQARARFAAMQRSLQQMIDQQARLLGGLQQADTVVDTLASDARQIGSVLGVIQGIAEQTNLLALNAAIEAARAGEQGRSFAVVADEVRQLAQRTSRATEEVVEIIDALQRSSSQAQQTMNTAAQQARGLEQETQGVRDSLDEVDQSLQQMHSQARDIALAAQQQAEGAQAVDLHIHQLHDMTCDNRQTAEQTRQSGEHLQQLAGEQQELVSRFVL